MVSIVRYTSVFPDVRQPRHCIRSYCYPLFYFGNASALVKQGNLLLKRETSKLVLFVFIVDFPSCFKFEEKLASDFLFLTGNFREALQIIYILVNRYKIEKKINKENYKKLVFLSITRVSKKCRF